MGSGKAGWSLLLGALEKSAVGFCVGCGPLVWKGDEGGVEGAGECEAHVSTQLEHFSRERASKQGLG